MDKVRLGVIGCGGMSKVHLNTVGGALPSIAEEVRPFAEQI